MRGIGDSKLVTGLLVCTAIVVALLATQAGHAAEPHTTGVFAGVKVNGGTATHTNVDGHRMLTLSSDFVIPDTPDPHWQVVDAEGRVHLLQRLEIKDDRVNLAIELPGYVPNVAKVQIWCAWAEALLGEAAFAQPVN